MYHVIIIEDDPMVAAINKQYVEVTASFQAVSYTHLTLPTSDLV